MFRFSSDRVEKGLHFNTGRVDCVSMSDLDTIIKELGGPTKLATALNCAPQVVCNWRARGFIHWRWHDSILNLARNKGVDVTRDALQRRHPVPKRKRAA